jgi:hypothetical protein
MYATRAKKPGLAPGWRAYQKLNIDPLGSKVIISVTSVMTIKIIIVDFIVVRFGQRQRRAVVERRFNVLNYFSGAVKTIRNLFSAQLALLNFLQLPLRVGQLRRKVPDPYEFFSVGQIVQAETAVLIPAAVFVVDRASALLVFLHPLAQGDDGFEQVRRFLLIRQFKTFLCWRRLRGACNLL